MTIFDYEDEDAVGTVAGVDTTSVDVEVSDISKLRTLQVNRLVVLRSSHAGQHLIGLISRISRRIAPASRTPTDDAEDDLRIENVLQATLIGTLVDLVGTDANVFRRTLETVPEIQARCFILEGERLTAFMRAITRQIEGKSDALALGHYALDAGAEAWLDGNKFFQRHAVIVGSTGSGKSWTVAKLLEQVASLTSANALLFDIHGEYKPLDGPGIQHLRVAGPGDSSLGLADDVVHLPHWLLTYEELIAMLLDRSDQNAPNQAMVFSREVKKLKKAFLESEGRTKVLANFTIDSPVPFSLNEVIGNLVALDAERVPGVKAGDKAGPYNGKLTRFIQRLEAKAEDRRLGFMFDCPDETSKYDWLDELANRLLAPSEADGRGGVKIMDFSEVPSDILPLIVGLVARLVFSIQTWAKAAKRHPIVMMCDEAHLYIPQNTTGGSIAEAGLRTFERVAKEGRKYGTALLVISQRPADVNRTVLSQCSNFVVMRLTNADDQAVIRKLLPDSLSGFSALLPILDVGEALVVGDASLLPSRIRVASPLQKPNSATINIWDEWSLDDPGQDIASAVESMRSQTTGS